MFSTGMSISLSIWEYTTLLTVNILCDHKEHAKLLNAWDVKVEREA